MVSQISNLSEAIMAAKKLEKTFLKNEFLTIDRDRNKLRLSFDRHMDTFLQLTRKRHETWYRNDKYFRDALRKEKDRHEKRKERNGSAISRTNTNISTLTSLVTSTTRAEPMTKVEQRTYQVLRDSQKLLDESAARSKHELSHNRPLTSPSRRINSPTRSSCLSSLNFPVTKSIDSEEYDRLVNESLKRETFSEFVDHFVKFRPEYREQFPQLNQANKRQNAVEKLRKFNQSFAKTKDKRYHDLINTLNDLHFQKK